MINIRPLIEQRLREQIPAFREVAGAADLSNILQGRINDSSCYVFEERRMAAENAMANIIRQRISQQFACVVVVRNVRDARGGDAQDVSAELQQSIQTALLGWEPGSTIEPLEYAGGSLVSFANGFFIWKESYKTAQTIRSA